MDEQMIKIGFTHGDINGISYELLLKTFSDARIVELCTPIIYGSSKIAAYHRKALELPAINMSSISRAEDVASGRINIINCANDEVKVELSRPTQISGEAAMQSLNAAVTDYKRGNLDAIITLPVSNRIILSKFYPVLSSYLERTLKVEKGGALSMLLYDDTVRFALLTENIPLSQVVQSVTKSSLVEKLLLLNRTLKEDFAIVKPRIAILSLNPRAGAGHSEMEEESIIIPAMNEVSEQGIIIFGPYPADSFFGSRMYKQFDCTMAMFYDQIAGACKVLYETGGVHCTAGLPCVHTAPAHGAAYDIAGLNQASDDAFRRSIYTAIDIYRNRIAYRKATANPLRKQYFDKDLGDDSVDLTKDENDDLLSL
ncbi:MAG: 4-hydroxythreonine-4-phosphate dehydrogenase PdxA [Tannerellaceae bacterium]|jgi:4-hydroxythreonine-4-phosphate dehydrogenase|nr:4-hydroxythreonine-4-phosphate dehydrogenase PdxA [Tannerellaceae bacterium]